MSVTSGWGRLTWGQANWNQATTLKTGWLLSLLLVETKQQVMELLK